MFYFHLFLSVFQKAYFRFFVSLNPLIKIFLLPSPSLPPSSLPPFLPLSLPSCLFFFFPFQASRFSLFQKSCCTQCLRSDLCLLPSAPGAADARPTAAAPGAGVCAAAASLGTSHFFSELWHHVRLISEAPPPPALVLQRPPLSGTGNPLPGPGLAYQSPWRAGPGPGRGGSAVAPF